jgi:hypothetical protein
MSAPEQVKSAKFYLDQFLGAEQDGRMTIVAEAESVLSKSQFKIFRKGIKDIEDEEKAAGSDAESQIVLTPGPSTRGGVVGAGEKVEEAKGVVEVTEKEIESFWKELESMSGDELINNQIVQDFQYIGFDPNTIMRTIIQIGKTANKTVDQIKSDIAAMCTIAIIKGSITDNNLKKMSDAGKKTYSTLEATYGLKRGGSKGLDPKVVTIARVGAAFPGSMMQILMKRGDLSKKFSGPFGTKILPPYLRHQSAAACIPESLNDDAKTFLLGIITAYTSDQSKIISRSKDSGYELFERQENFITQTHSSSYPSESVRRSIFKSWSLVADYDKIKIVADNIIKSVKTFELMSKEDFTQSVNSV